MRRKEREALRIQAEAVEARLQAALRRDRSPSALVAEIGPASPLMPRVAATAELTPKFRRLLEAVARRAPRLLDPYYVAVLHLVSSLGWDRELSDWKPRGKGRETVFRDLCIHLLARYPMPPILWTAFFEPSARVLAPVVSIVARGGSLFTSAQQGVLPVPLTRQMCHDLLAARGDRFVEAMRRAQMLPFRGDPSLLRAWMSNDVGRLVHDRASEEFWATVLRWFCQNPTLDRRHVGPLLDYIAFRRREDASFSMKGRAVLAMLRGMRQWHGELARERVLNGVAFKASGFMSFAHKTTAGRHEPEQVWTVNEILTSRELAAEGRALHHCVYSYAPAVERRQTSIWSLRRDGERMVTVELRNETRQVVQARGNHNRMMTAAEGDVLKRWAAANHLDVNSSLRL